MTTFTTYDHLPAPIREAFAELEDMLGDLDGKTIATPADENTFIDEGTIVMDDAVKAFNTLVSALSPPEPTEELRAHKIMTSEEYRDLNLKGWHMVCKDYDGPHSVGVRYTGDQTGAMPLQDRVREVPVCAVTGRIAGDADACFDCDPCSAASSVPVAVKRLLAEKEEWRQKYGEVAAERDAMVAEQETK